MAYLVGIDMHIYQNTFNIFLTISIISTSVKPIVLIFCFSGTKTYSICIQIHRRGKSQNTYITLSVCHHHMNYDKIFGCLLYTEYSSIFRLYIISRERH